MTYLAFCLLLSFALVFSSYERRLWGSGKTPFAFVVYPFLAILFLALFVAPGMGFLPLHVETVLVIGLFFMLIAIASVALGRLAGVRARTPSRLEALGTRLNAGGAERTVGSLEYLALGGILLLFFASSLLGSGSERVAKGELGVGGIGGHLLELGMAYLLIAACQHRGQRVVRAWFALLVLWLLAINQVKYLILLPLAGALLYRWVSGQLATWKLALVALVVPLTVVTVVYSYFGLAAAGDGVQLTPALVGELAKHMVAYLVSGITGLDQLLIQAKTVAFGTNGLQYALAPFLNLLRFVTGVRDYFNVVNPLYLVIHDDGVLDSNVFTVFGSLLYRGGWVGAVSITLVYALIGYWMWSRWRMRDGALASAAGSWWMATMLFAWFDPFFTLLSIIEVMAILWVRGKLRLPGFAVGALWRTAGGTTASTGP